MKPYMKTYMKMAQVENRLLLAAARRSLNLQENKELGQLISKDLDWEFLFVAARRHGLMPLLYKHLHSISDYRVPEYFLMRLRHEVIANAQSNLYLAGELLRVTNLFKKQGIRALVFKGVILSQLVYGENSLRQAGDIDLLIGRKHFAPAKEMLESIGYRMTPCLTAAQQLSHLSSHCEIQFMRDDGFTVLDLHWGLSPRSFRFGLVPEAVMERSQRIYFGGEEIETFSIEDIILYQCFHGTKHSWRQLESISSLSALITSSPQIDWAVVVDRASGARARRMLMLGLLLAQQVTNAPVPEFVFTKLGPDEEIRDYATQLAADLFEGNSAACNPLEIFRSSLKIMDRRSDALAGLLRSIFVPTLSDWEAMLLPETLRLFYYPYRLLRLTTLYAGSLWRRFLPSHKNTNESLAKLQS